MTSLHIISLTDTQGNAQTGQYVYIYKHGLYINPTDRVQCVEVGTTGVYYFDSEHANLEGASSYDVGAYTTDPGLGNHTTAFSTTNNIPLSIRENRYFGAKTTITTLKTHTTNTSNPHSVTLTQACDAQGWTHPTALELKEVTDGSVTILHSHSGVTPSAHAPSHNAGGSDVIAVTNALLPAATAIGAVEALKIRLADAGGNYAATDVENAFAELFPTLPAPTGLSASGTQIPSFAGIKVLVTASWNSVTGAESYVVECKGVSGTVHQKEVQGLIATFHLGAEAGYQVRVKARKYFAYSPWTAYVDVIYTFESSAPDLLALQKAIVRLDKVCDASGAPTGAFATAIVAISSAVQAEVPILIETATDIHTSDPAQTGWLNVVDPIPFTKTSDTNYMYVACNLYTSNGLYPAELRMQFEEPNGTLHPSDSVKTTSTSAVNEITFWFKISTWGVTGNCKAHIQYKNENATASAKVNTLKVYIKT